MDNFEQFKAHQFPFDANLSVEVVTNGQYVNVSLPYEKRVAAWQKVAELLPESYYAAASNEIALEAVPEAAAQIIRGEITGRTLVKL